MTHFLQTRFGTALLVVSTVVLALSAVWNFQHRRTFRLPDDGVIWGETDRGVVALGVDPQGPGAKAGLRPGDHLIQINGFAVRKAPQVTQVLAGLGVWQKASYGIKRNGVELRKSLIVAAAERNPAIDYFQWALAIFYLAIGILVLWRHGFEEHEPRPMVRHFYVFCLASFVLYSFSYTGELDAFDRFVYWADVWAVLLVPALFLHFCLVFPAARQVSAGRRVAAAIGYLPAAAMLIVHHLAASGALRSGATILETRFLLDRAPYLLLGLYFMLGALILKLGRTPAEETVLRQQRKWLASGALWGVLPFVVFYIVPFVGGEIPGPNRSLSVFSLGLIPLAFAYAIVKHRLMDVDLVFRRGAAYSLATATLLAAFYGLVFLVGGMVQPQLSQLGPASWVVSVVVAALLFHPLRDWIQQSLDRRFYRERYDYRRTLVDFAAELSTETDLERMVSLSTERLAATLDLARMAVFVADPESDSGGARQFRLMRGLGLSTPGGAPLDSAAGLDLSFLPAQGRAGNGARPYLFFETPRWRIEQPPAVRRTLATLDLNYYVPCQVHGRTIAYLGLGRTRGGDFLSTDDLSLVQAVSGYFAVALENARLYSSLERKATEYQRLKDYNENIVESLHVGIVAVDLDDRVESWNTPLELMFGISRRQAVGRRLAELLPAALVAEFDRVRGESGVHNISKFHLRADAFPAEFRPAAKSNGSGDSGEERILNVAVAPLVAKNFDPIGRLIILDDVTEQVELEEQVVQADKLSSIGLLAAGVAHEVNTPLAVISSYAQMLAKKVATDPGQTKILQKITSQTFRASEIVNSLLTFSRTSTREFAPLDLNRTLQETLSLIEPQLRHAQIEIETEYQPEAAAVVGNSGKLQQVFLNLLLNARDAMPHGGRLTLRTRLAEAENGETLARVIVSDTGTGIRPDDLKHIFDPFFTTKGPGRGNGLGLAVSYGIVQEHSGNISVDSAAGEGTTFRVDLPLSGKPIHA